MACSRELALVIRNLLFAMWFVAFKVRPREGLLLFSETSSANVVGLPVSAEPAILVWFSDGCCLNVCCLIRGEIMSAGCCKTVLSGKLVAACRRWGRSCCAHL